MSSIQLLGTKLELKDDQLSADWHRMVQAHTFASNTPAAHKINEIRAVAGRLGVNQLVVETTFLYISKLQRQDAFRRKRLLAQGSFALACRNHNPAMSLKPIAAAFGMTPMGLAGKMHEVADELHLRVPRPDKRRSYMEAVVSLGLPHSFYLGAMNAVEQTIAADPTGGTETSFFAAALYRLAKDAGRRGVTQKRVAAALGLAEYTVREVCEAKFKPHP